MFYVLLLTLSAVQHTSSFKPKTFVSAPTQVEESTTWAVLVAGSNGFYNYRHQANVCHAYQILKKGGLKDENIIVFMFDDIANNPNNPMPGVIINSPKGSDVYAGVPKDYTGESVTAENFYAVLLGNRTAVKGGSGKVVASKPNDRIFVYYTDHGAPGLLGMTYRPVYANEFIQVLIKKHASGTYDKMVIYVAASNSGSMFEGLLPDNLNIYALTSTSANEDGCATYCPYDTENPSPQELHNCLGDLFSVSWLEDSDSQDLSHETLEQQYSKVKERTLNKRHPSNGSHVMRYGTLSISSEIVSLYLGSAAGNYSTDPAMVD